MIQNIVSYPGQAFTGAFLFGENEITAGNGTGERTEIVGDVRFLERNMG
jgi:hypothetical protein